MPRKKIFSKTLHIRLSKIEWFIAEKISKNFGITPSEWIRYAMVSHRPKPKDVKQKRPSDFLNDLRKADPERYLEILKRLPDPENDEYKRLLNQDSFKYLIDLLQRNKKGLLSIDPDLEQAFKTVANYNKLFKKKKS